uniref:Uncharacterized protein n=1 Tax=Panagrolaimus davidi TaxID=227884 RepID=A0A914Q762_9BILA
MNQINSQVDEEPDFSVFQEPPNVQSFVASPLPSTSASRVFNRLRCGSRINKRRSKQITDSDIPSLPNTQSTNDENFDDDNDGPDDVFDDFSPAPVITEKKEKSLTRWIFEEILAFIICLIYLAGFNVLLKTFL